MEQRGDSIPDLNLQGVSLGTGWVTGFTLMGWVRGGSG